MERQGKYPESEALQSRTLQTMTGVAPEHPDTLKSMNALAWVYNHEAKYAQGRKLFLNQALEIERRVQGPERPETLASMNSLANVYNNEGKVLTGRGALQPGRGD